MRIENLSPGIGSVVHDLDLSQPLSSELVSEVKALWLDRLIIVFRGQSISSEQYLSFASR